MESRAPKFLLPPSKTLWMLLAQAAVVAPHALRVPLWITVAALALGLWRYQASRRYWRTPTRVVRLTLVAAGITGVLASYHTVLGRDAGVALLLVMLSLKLLELNQTRDVMVFLFMGYFLVITNFLYSQQIAMAVYMFASVLLLTAALLAVAHPGPEPPPSRRLRQAGALLLQALPLMLLLFVLFPRIPGPLWRLPNDAHSGITGLGSTMTPGNITRLARSHAVAFRVHFDGPEPDPGNLYWRGPVLWRFDGRGWTGGWDQSHPGSPPAPRGPRIRYTVTLEPTGHRWLLALDRPATAPPGVSLTRSYQLVASKRILERRRYTLTSRLATSAGPAPLSAAARAAALQLPSSGNPRTRALAQRLRRQVHSDRAYVRRVLAMFHNQPFSYTLNPPPLGANPVDQFLFHTRRGFCEHYASAFAVLMRAAGIPARVVTGYQGGEFNPVGDYLIVRQSRAHAWTEVWLPGRGWTREDPTAAINPIRVDASLAATLPELERRDAFGTLHSSLLHRLGLAWDSVDNAWNQWVLSYGPQLQLQLLAGLGFGNLSWLGMATDLAVAVIALLALGFLYMAWRNRPPPSDPVVRLYREFCTKLERLGLSRALNEGPLDFAERIARARPDLATRVRRITRMYIALHYGGADRTHRHKLQTLVRGFAPRALRRRTLPKR